MTSYSDLSGIFYIQKQHLYDLSYLATNKVGDVSDLYSKNGCVF